MPVVMTLLSQKGGVGKTTLARALAVALARAKVNALLADCDARQSTAAQWNKMREERRLSPHLNIATSETMTEALEQAKTFEVVIVDLPGHTSRSTLEAAQKSHVIVHPTGPTLDDLYPSVLLFHELAGAGIPKERLVFALCRTLVKAEEDAAREYLERAGYEVLPGTLGEKLGYRQAHNRGASALETDDKVLNAQASALVDAILRKANDEVEKLAREQERKGGKRSA